MKRLVAFGCSSTTGQGLSDTWIDGEVDGDIISKFAWPSVLADMYGVPSEVIAYAGNCNKRIAHDALNFKYSPEDHVFILWTMPVRTCVMEGPKTLLHMINPINENFEDYYTKYYTDYDHNFMDTLYKTSVASHLEKRNVKYTFLYFGNAMNAVHGINPEEVWWGTYYNEEYGFCEDGTHASQEAHYDFAKAIYKHVGN